MELTDGAFRYAYPLAKAKPMPCFVTQVEITLILIADHLCQKYVQHGGQEAYVALGPLWPPQFG